MEPTCDLVRHSVQVAEDCGPARHGYRAECTCAWASECTEDELAAVLDAQEHRHMTGGPGDETDRVLNQLLDLQDDVAEVVVWLADHWTASLPAPAFHGCDIGHDGPVVQLVALCPDDATVAHIAGLLDVEVSDGHLQTAHRWFGQILFQAIGMDRVQGPGS